MALGGNALLKRGQPLTAENQRRNVAIAAEALAPLAHDYQLVISHGNGPQVGLLSLQSAAYEEVEEYPLDILGAQTEGMIGYMIEQELGNLLPMEEPLATILTMVEVDPEDPAFDNPTKPIGPVYSEQEAKTLADQKGWSVAPDGEPQRSFEMRPIHWLLENGATVICAGGGGIPTVYKPDGTLEGVEVVVDKDRASALLAFELDAGLLILATDTDGVYLDWGTEDARRIERVTPEQIEQYEFEEGSMRPKVEAACGFVRRSGGRAVIGSLTDMQGMVAGTAGTQFVLE